MRAGLLANRRRLWSLREVLLVALLCAASCSKDNQINQTKTVGVGEQCSGPDDRGCGEGAVCVLGFCRLGCTTDAECPQGALCLGDRKPFGCSLPSELACSSTQPCKAPLTCGIDGRCRLGCGATSDCPRNEQECIATTCAGHGESGADGTWFSCAEGDRRCTGTTLEVCNATTPGWSSQACATVGLCTAGLAAGSCATPACAAGEKVCEGAALRKCNADRTAFDVDTCATAGLCTAGLSAGACATPACAAGESKCEGGFFKTCRADRTAFAEQACAGSTAQCSPTVGCIHLAIDATEVTRAQYAQFLAAKSGGTNVVGQLPECSWNTTYAPDAACLSNTYFACSGNCDNRPQVCVDWCDAYMYCGWKGQHLCGGIGGGPNAPAAAADPSADEWMNACSSGGQNVYPYGSGFSGTACNINVNGMQRPVDVATFSGCESPVPGYAGVFDLSGNVAEWEDSCEGTGPTAPCLVRGGTHRSAVTTVGCDATGVGGGPTDGRPNRNSAYTTAAGAADGLGIRCCGDPGSGGTGGAPDGGAATAGSDGGATGGAGGTAGGDGGFD